MGFTAKGQARFRPPNVVVILPDMWRGQALGCMGNPDVQTPNLDELAAQGMLFRHTFANTPLCCPARAILWTGTYASKNGMVANDLRLRESCTTIANVLSAAGYATGYIGKWHLDGGPRLPGFVPPGPRRHGFKYWAANECDHSNYFDTQYFRDDPVPILIKKFEVEAWFDLAIEFVSNPKNRPFFLVIAPSPPHEPYAAPVQYSRTYDPQKLEMRPDWTGEPTIGGEGKGRRLDIATYYASITAIDVQVGRLMRALARLGLEGDTIVLFISDHGNMLGSQGWTGKQVPWEESIRVPGILSYPSRIRAGQRAEALLSHVDIAPTLLGLCGAAVPQWMQGQNLASFVLGESTRTTDSVFFQIFGPWHHYDLPAGWRGVRTSRYMYAEWQSGPWLLYDLLEDPSETENLARRPNHSTTLREMKSRLAEWMRRAGDSWSFDWTVPVMDNGRLYRHKAFYSVDEYLKWAKEHGTTEDVGEKK